MNSTRAALCVAIAASGLSCAVARAEDSAAWFTASAGYGQNVDDWRLGVAWVPCECDWLIRAGLEPRLWAHVGFWDARRSGSPNNELWEAGLMPVVRWPVEPASRWKPFLEFGVGAGLLSHTQIGDRKLGIAFQFQEQLSAGFALDAAGRYELAAFVSHTSNARIVPANDGLTTYGVELRAALP